MNYVGQHPAPDAGDWPAPSYCEESVVAFAQRATLLVQSMRQTREQIAFDVIKLARPASWLNYRNENWGRSAYLRRRRGWAPK